MEILLSKVYQPDWVLGETAEKAETVALLLKQGIVLNMAAEEEGAARTQLPTMLEQVVLL